MLSLRGARGFERGRLDAPGRANEQISHEIVAQPLKRMADRRLREAETDRQAALSGDPGMTRTSDLRFRKPPLYPAELRDREAHENQGERLRGPYQKERLIASLRWA
jgi:hypothetical protein